MRFRFCPYSVVVVLCMGKKGVSWRIIYGSAEHGYCARAGLCVAWYITAGPAYSSI